MEIRLSRLAKVSIMLGLSTAMFFIELIVGVIAGSIALVADSFHMLNDVLGMVIALWAIKAAKSKEAVPNNTYGWQRAEILGALTNGVLLLGLCLTIYIDAIQRFINIEEVSNPKLVMIVGCIGFTFNVMGLVLFHDHGHGHGHSHGHSHSHDHASHDEIEDGHHVHDEDEEELMSNEQAPLLTHQGQYGSLEHRDTSDSATVSGSTSAVGTKASANHTSLAYETDSIIGVPHPVYTQQAIIKSAQNLQNDGTPSDSDEGSSLNSQQNNRNNSNFCGNQPTIIGPDASSDSYAGTVKKLSESCQGKAMPPMCSNKNKKKRKKAQGSGHLNMQGVWVHVFGDCVTNIAVIISGLVIWQCEGSWRFYFDPLMSLLINTLVVCITIPLVKSASFILLNGVPPSINVSELRKDLKDIPNVLNIHDLHVWQLSDTKYVSSLHVLIDRPSVHYCIHNSNSSSESSFDARPTIASAHGDSGNEDNDHGEDHQPSKNIKSARLVTRSKLKDALRGGSNVDMDCLYMEVAARVKKIMHNYGVHSTTIQPEFVVGQAVAVSTDKYFDSSNGGSSGDETSAEREGSILSHVAIVPDSPSSHSRSAGRQNYQGSGTIGPCLLRCSGNGNTTCSSGECCADEEPIAVVSGRNTSLK